MKFSFIALSATLLSLTALSGCSTTPPEAWQRGHLAKPIMQWTPDALESASRQQNYNSKEAAVGGGAAAGGGCGCR